MTVEQPTRSRFVVSAGIGTMVLAIAGIGLIARTMLDNARGRHIEDAPQTPLTFPLIAAGGLLLAAAWALWLVRTRGIRDVAVLIVSGTAVALLIVTPLLAWQAFTGERELTVITSTCNAESLRNTGGDPRTGCREETMDTIVLLEAVQGNESRVPHNTGNLTRTFANLPPGSWDARLTVDGPPATVSVVVIAERDGKPRRLGTLRPGLDAESGRLHWSGVIPVANDVSRLQVQFCLSPNPAAESARIRLNVRSCAGQSIRTFDSSMCRPMETDTPLIYEQLPAGARTWRQLVVQPEGDSFVVSNLEARTYTLQPDYVRIEQLTQSTDVLLIPAAMEQVAGNSITEPGKSSFELEIDALTGELTYVMYVFPTGPTFAGIPMPTTGA